MTGFLLIQVPDSEPRSQSVHCPSVMSNAACKPATSSPNKRISAERLEPRVVTFERPSTMWLPTTRFLNLCSICSATFLITASLQILNGFENVLLELVIYFIKRKELNTALLEQVCSVGRAHLSVDV